MKFTTPAMASEPYSAEAPSVSTSTRSIASSGRLSRFTEPSPPEEPKPPKGATRRPFSNTSVYFWSRPWMAAVVVPLPLPLTELEDLLEVAAGHRRQLLDQLADRLRAGLVDGVARDDGDRQGAFGLDTTDRGAGDLDALRRGIGVGSLGPRVGGGGGEQCCADPGATEHWSSFLVGWVFMSDRSPGSFPFVKKTLRAGHTVARL